MQQRAARCSSDLLCPQLVKRKIQLILAILWLNQGQRQRFALLDRERGSAAVLSDLLLHTRIVQDYRLQEAAAQHSTEQNSTVQYTVVGAYGVLHCIVSHVLTSLPLFFKWRNIWI